MVTILIGPSGAGKSTWAAQHAATMRAVVVSADTFFYDAQGVYRFDPIQLQDAHNTCLRAFLEHVRTGPVIVDNTNLTVADIAPYIAIADAYGTPVEIRVFGTSGRPGELTCRNIHGVHMHTIMVQKDKLAVLRREWPVRWPTPIVMS